MSARTERRLLQLIVAIACLLPLVVGGESIVRGPAAVGKTAVGSADLDSHFRYLSGIFFALGLAFVSCIPRIEATGPRFRLLGAFVIAGGCARLVSLLAIGAPSTGHLVGLGVELGAVPLLLVWQASLARRWRAAARL